MTRDLSGENDPGLRHIERMLRMMSVSALLALTVTVSMVTLDMDLPVMPVSGMGNPVPNTELAPEKQWLSSYDEGKSIAQQKKIPLLLHFEADWCGACRVMDSSVMNQESVLSHLGTSVVAVRINADRDPGLISHYGITSLPTEVYIGEDGKELGRYVGGTSLTEYQARLQNVKSLAKSSLQPVVTEPSDENLRPCLLVKREGHVVGFGGYSPVAMLKEKKWLKGNEEFLGSYLGVDYFFQTAEERDLFMASPELYIPRLHGFDPVELQLARRAEAGAIELGAFYKGRLFFFLNEANRKRFQNNPAWYAEGLSTDGIQNVDQYPFLKSMTLN